MNENKLRIRLLFERLEILSKRQDSFFKEIEAIRIELELLYAAENETISTPKEEIKEVTNVEFTAKPIAVASENSFERAAYERKMKNESAESIFDKIPNFSFNSEQFIGENLISKIGIIITVIGVSIGAKYAIDHELISPLTRIIMAYIFGAVLFGFAIKLKEKYIDYSAVLMSGSMAILYFITYAAYSYYSLFQQIPAFLLMLFFTVITVFAALNYNRQVIAHIGFVGAYAIPFLLSDETGNVAILFSYMVIINLGILIVSFKKYWKSLYYAAFIFTWLIFGAWYSADYLQENHYVLAFVFLSIFFAIFYTTFLVYKLVREEKFEKADIFLLLLNTFIFYGFGYALLENNEIGTQFLGFYTVGNVIIHTVVSLLIIRQKSADKNLLYLVIGLALVFVTLAIPVQLSGNWVTLFWVFEAALLFWIGRTKNTPFYEMLAYPLFFLAFFSLIHDWSEAYNRYIQAQPETRVLPIFNTNFLISALFIAAYGFINWLNINKKYVSPLAGKQGLYHIIAYSIPAILIAVLYFAFRIEIETYYNQLYTDSTIIIAGYDPNYPDYYFNYELNKFKGIWVLNYSLVFVSLLAFVNFKFIKNAELHVINYGLHLLAIAMFLTYGLLTMSELRETYLSQNLANYYPRGFTYIGIRYISYVFLIPAVWSLIKLCRPEKMLANYQRIAFIVLHTSILWILSSELINLMDLAQSQQMYKLGLSILWGVYALWLIILGIWKKQQYLRIGAIGLFAVTLAKLFVYDISHLNTISKTIVFVLLGVLLLLISFLYNKFRSKIMD